MQIDWNRIRQERERRGNGRPNQIEAPRFDPMLQHQWEQDQAKKRRREDAERPSRGVHIVDFSL